MSEKKSYVPSEEEEKRAESHMTRKQKDLSVHRRHDYLRLEEGDGVTGRLFEYTMPDSDGKIIEGELNGHAIKLINFGSESSKSISGTIDGIDINVDLAADLYYKYLESAEDGELENQAIERSRKEIKDFNADNPEPKKINKKEFDLVTANSVANELLKAKGPVNYPEY